MLLNVVPEYVMETEAIEDMDTKGRKIRQIVDPEEKNPKSKVF